MKPISIYQEQTMTSLEIAELTGKQHKHVMEAIRKMEPAWMNVAGSNFRLGSYKDANSQLRPCYQLTKTECLYIATKFNDEARARLVLRWQELEMAERSEKLRVKSEKRGVLLLGCSDEEILEEADDIIGEELQELNKYTANCYSPTDIGKVYGMDGRDLNSFLCDIGIIRWTHGQWMLTPKYRNQGLTETKSFIYHGNNGRRKTQSRLVWTEKGREFVIGLIVHSEHSS
jgi:phage regulator Rha-like protein